MTFVQLLHLRSFLPSLLSILFLTVTVLPVANGSSLIQWHKTWGGNNSDHASAVASDVSNHVYVTGREGSFAQSTTIVLPGGFLLKYDTLGNLLWQRVWGNGSDYWHQGEGVATDSKNNIYVVGESANASSGSPFRIFLFKFDANGNVLWQRMWWEGSGGSGDFGYGLAVSPSGKIYVAGMTANFGAGGYDAVLLIFNSTGSLIRQETWGGPGGDGATGVDVDLSGNVYVVGFTLSYGAPGYNLFLLRFDSLGNLVWHRTWGPTSYDGSPNYRVTTDSDGNVYAIGRTNAFGAGGDDAFILKFNSTGDLLWQRVWGGSAKDEASDVATDYLGNIYVVGSTQSFSGGNSCYSPPCADAFILKIDRNGTLISQNTWGGSNDDAAYGVATDSSGSALVTGSVRESPPYVLGSGNNTLGKPNFNATPSGSDTLGKPAFSAVPLMIPIRTVSGNEKYSGLNENAFLFKYGISIQSSTTIGPMISATLLTVCLALALRRKATDLRCRRN